MSSPLSRSSEIRAILSGENGLGGHISSLFHNLLRVAVFMTCPFPLNQLISFLPNWRLEMRIEIRVIANHRKEPVHIHGLAFLGGDASRKFVSSPLFPACIPVCSCPSLPERTAFRASEYSGWRILRTISHVSRSMIAGWVSSNTSCFSGGFNRGP